MILHDEDFNDYNYYENLESDNVMYEYELNDIKFNRDFDNMNNYKEWGLIK